MIDTLRSWLREFRRKPRRPVAARRFDLSNEMAVGPAVCVEHMRTLPCRVGDDTCIISQQPEDVLMVHEQRKGQV